MSSFIQKISLFISRGVYIAFGVVACIAFVSLLVFPAFKGVWIGYFPILFGGILAHLFAVHYQYMRTHMMDAVMRIPSASVYVALLISIGSVLQIILITVFNSIPQVDGLFVYNQALELSQTGRMSLMTYYPPAQIWWYALVFKLFAHSYIVAQLSHLPFYIGIILVTYHIAVKVCSEEQSRIIALLTAFYPSFLLYVLVIPYYFYLYTFLTLLFAWCLLNSGKKGGRIFPLAAGCVGAFAALTKAVMLIAPIQASLFYFCIYKRAMVRNALACTLLTLCGFVIVLSPWVYRNYTVFGESVMVCTSGGLVLYSANNLQSNGLYNALPDDALIHTPREMLEYGKECSRKAIQVITSYPAHFIKLVIRKILHTWGNETTYTELINVSGHTCKFSENAMSFIIQMGWSMVVLLWSGSFLYSFQTKIHNLQTFDVLVSVLIVTNFFVYCVYEGGARHHLPFVPLLLIYSVRLLKNNEK